MKQVRSATPCDVTPFRIAPERAHKFYFNPLHGRCRTIVSKATADAETQRGIAEAAANENTELLEVVSNAHCFVFHCFVSSVLIPRDHGVTGGGK
jgi:hypothetical protein